MDYIKATRHEIGLMDYVTRGVLGAACWGVSVGGYGTRIHADGGLDEQANAILENAEALNVSIEGSIIQAATVNPVQYRIISEGALWDEGITEDGGIILEHSGTFRVLLYDTISYASAQTEVQNA